MKKVWLSTVLLFTGALVCAQTWNGSTSTDWNTGANWSSGSVPVAASNVVIPGALSNYPVLGNNTTINSISMQSGSQLDVNGFTFTINGVSATSIITGATLNNSNGVTDIEINLSTGSSGYYAYFRNNIVNDNIVFNLTGSYDFFEADVASSANQYNGNVTFNLNSYVPLRLSGTSPSVYNGDLTVNRTVAGPTDLFNSGATISGSLNYTNNAGGATVIGNTTNKTSIGGMVNISVSNPSANSFVLRRLINQTTGGNIMIENSAGFHFEQDTLSLSNCSIKNYYGGAYASLLNNKIAGNINLSDSSIYGGGYYTTIRSNEITGNTTITIKGTNTLYEADAANSGNKYFGNAVFNCEGGYAYIAHADALTCTGNMTISRLSSGSATITAFNSGGTISGDFTYTNNYLGHTYLGNAASKTSIGGHINISVNNTSPQYFVMNHFINQTGGGNINILNSAGFHFYNDTLKVSALNILGYRGGDYGYLFNNSITGNVTTADDASYSGGYSTALRNNLITGNCSFTNNGGNHFYDADVANTANKYMGNVAYTGAGGGHLYIGYGDSLYCNGNLSINRTFGAFTQAFNNGATINGNFSYNNSTSGNTYLGNTASKTSIAGKVDVTVDYTSTSIFQMMRLINQTNGGIIDIKNSAGFYIANDTLSIVSLSVTGYKDGGYGYLFNNEIVGNVTTAADAGFGGGYNTVLRKNSINGNCSFTNNGSNHFYDADISGTANKYQGNVSYTGAGSGILFIGYQDSLNCSGNLSINITGTSQTYAFSSGATINGNFSYNNSSSGNTYLGNTSMKTEIGGTINITANFISPSIFRIIRFINQTSGGNISVQNSQGFYVVNDTLKLNTLSITGYTNGQYGELYSNDITGNVTIADNAAYSGGFNTYVRNNVITGNTSFTENGSAELYAGQYKNKYIGNVTFTRNAGAISIGNSDTTEITQNLTLNSAAGISLGHIMFSGSTNGAVEQLGTQPINIPFLTIEKTGGARITLNDTVYLTNTANLINGNIFSSAANQLIFQSGATYTGGSDASYIDGPATKFGNSSFTFPVGNAGKIAPISISAPAGVTDAFSAQYFKLNPNTAGYDTSLRDPSLHHTSGKEYWKLDRTNGTSDAKVTLSWDATRSGGINNITELRIARWDGSTWKDEGNGGTSGNNSTGLIQTLNPVTSFSPFTLASSTALNPLPIILVNFEGSKCNNGICLLWSTENEQNFSHFVVEKSKNGTDFSMFSTITAHYTGQRNTYTITDNSPANGVNFYRLRIVDNNGTFSYSRIVKVDFSKPLTVTVQPNPATDIIILKGTEGYQLVRIVDLSGSIRIQKTIQNSIQEINISSLPAGMYLVQLLNGKEKEIIKMMKL